MERDDPRTRDAVCEVLEGFDAAVHEAEAQRRWGHTDAYRESARRTRGYSVEDWRRYAGEARAATTGMAELLDAGVPATDPRAMDAADALRLLIDRWFYPCSLAMHAELGRMVTADSRFAATYEAVRPGLARYVGAAILANAARDTV